MHSFIFRYTAGAKRSKFLKRLFKFGHMDFQFAMWQMFYLFVSPQKVFRDFAYRKREYTYTQTYAYAHKSKRFYFNFFLWCRNQESICTRRSSLPRSHEPSPSGDLHSVRSSHAVELRRSDRVHFVGGGDRLHWRGHSNRQSLLVCLKSFPD